MLPQNQIEGGIFIIPKFNIEKQDVESFMEKLQGFHNEFKNCFQRSEPREHFFHYIVGQFSELEGNTEGRSYSLYLCSCRYYL